MAKRNRKALIRVLVTLLLVILASGLFLAWVIFAPNTVHIQKATFFYVPTGAVYGDVVDSLASRRLLRHPRNFQEVAGLLDYPNRVIAGRYRLTEGMSNFELIRLLRSGRQIPVRLVINKERTAADMARLLSRELEPDSAAFMALFNDSVYLKQYQRNPYTALCGIIPNTYQFFWNTSATATLERLSEEADKFWNAQRQAAADSLGLDEQQVYILASIIEEESNKTREKPLIASVYINRLRRGIRLYADPTVKFALQDFALKRINRAQTQVQSPYNTYIFAGLPPGPICTPSITTIDAVLQAPETDYLYFCAKPDFSGYHNFASTYREHLRNARAYHRALDQRNIH